MLFNMQVLLKQDKSSPLASLLFCVAILKAENMTFNLSQIIIQQIDLRFLRFL